MTTFTPNLVCTRVVPGTARNLEVKLRDLPTVGDLKFRIEGVDPLVEVSEVIVFLVYRRPWHPDELEDLPPIPPEVRETAALYATVEVSEEVDRGNGAVPVHLPESGIGEEIRVHIRLRCKAAASEPEKWHDGRLVAELDGSLIDELPLYLAVGTDGWVPEPDVSPERLTVWMDPGDSRQGQVYIAQAPVGGRLRACLIGSDAMIRLSETIVYREKRLSYEEAKRRGLLEDLPPEALQQIREEGYRYFDEVDRGTGTAPVRAAEGDRIRVNVDFEAPEKWGGVEEAVLVLIAPQWESVDVSVTAIVQQVGVTLEEDTFALGQGENVDLAVTVSSGLGTGGEVTFGISGSDGALSVPSSRLVYEPMAQRTIRIPLWVARSAPVGLVHNVALVASFSGGVTELRLPLRIEVVPGTTKVLTAPTDLGVPTGGSGSLTVAVHSGGGSKKIQLTPGPLPSGVTVESGMLTLQPADTEVQRVLRVDVHPENARLVVGLPFGIEWNSNNGQQRGTAVSRLTIFQRPESRTFSAPVITPSGVPLGGRAEFLINSDGSARFKGHMRATGLFSYKFTVRAVLQSRSGAFACIEQKTGEVFGSDTPGSRQFNWDEDASDQIIAANWPDFRSASISVSRATEQTGILGTAAELTGDVLEFAVASSVLLPFGPAGQCLSALVLVGSEIGDVADTSIIGAGGLSGLILAGGAAFLVGPTMIVPAFVGGVLIGEALVKGRALKAVEKEVALRLFGDTLPWDQIRLTNLSGPGNSMLTVPSTDDSILVNIGTAFDNPLTYVHAPYWMTPGQAFIHELTHAWQIAHKSFKSEYFWKGAVDITSGLTSGSPYTPYFYGPAGPSWRHFGLEEQASIVDEWWARRTDKAMGGFPPGAARPSDPEKDPYFRYISENIRMKETL